MCELSGSAPPASFCDWMLLIGSPTLKKLPSGLRMPLELFTLKTVPKPLPVAFAGREQDVRVGVAEVVVDAPAAADDVLAVAADVVGEARRAAGQLFLSSVGLLPKFSRPAMPASAPGLAGACEHHEVRVLRLVELHSR